MKNKFLLFSKSCLCVLLFLISIQITNAQSTGTDFPFLKPELPLQVRVNDLVSRLTLEEKILQMQHEAPAIERLGIPTYNWWNECLHGVARNGVATVFPQAIAMAATFNSELIFKEADVISTEARAKYYEAISKGSREIYQGLTFWSPNINIFRDPRWGRGQETYGEDPFLTAQIGKAFVKGLQGSDSTYFKVIATAKHFAVHSGPEKSRHKFDAWVSKRDLYDTYLPAFEALVREAKVYSVMGAYNRLYASPCCASDLLLGKILRNDWGFKGYVVSDCWAVSDFYSFHKVVSTPDKAATMAVKAGCDLACGVEYAHLKRAFEFGYITEKELDVSVKRLFEARFRLGLFDPPSLVPYSSILPSLNNTEENHKLAREVARQSIVLLKNQNSTLPFSKKIKSIAVIGPYADDVSVLLGNYNGEPSNPITLLEGIRNHAKDRKISVNYCLGAEKPDIIVKTKNKAKYSEDQLENEALGIAKSSDIIVFVGGISPNLEGEEMDVEVPGFDKGDRITLDLPENQLKLMEKLSLTGKPVVLVLTNGSALAVNWAQKNVSAIVEAWYSGEEGGNAVADILFGDYSPAGRLPITFYKSVNDLPDFENYAMKGRTYRYFKGEPLYAFGHGLSYTSFIYTKTNLKFYEVLPNDTIQLTVEISNKGNYDSDEVIQIYAKPEIETGDQPIKSLVAFKRVHFLKGETKQVPFLIPVKQLRLFEPETDCYQVPKGTCNLLIGASSDDIRLQSKVLVK